MDPQPAGHQAGLLARWPRLAPPRRFQPRGQGGRLPACGRHKRAGACCSCFCWRPAWWHWGLGSLVTASPRTRTTRLGPQGWRCIPDPPSWQSWQPPRVRPPPSRREGAATTTSVHLAFPSAVRMPAPTPTLPQPPRALSFPSGCRSAPPQQCHSGTTVVSQHHSGAAAVSQRHHIGDSFSCCQMSFNTRSSRS